MGGFVLVREEGHGREAGWLAWWLQIHTDTMSLNRTSVSRFSFRALSSYLFTLDRAFSFFLFAIFFSFIRRITLIHISVWLLYP